jgi:hypothetical protein
MMIKGSNFRTALQSESDVTGETGRFLPTICLIRERLNPLTSGAENSPAAFRR